MNLTKADRACIINLIETLLLRMERKMGMREFTYTIKNAYGIHARPAGMLVKMACEFDSSIQLECGGRTVDLKRIMAVMAMQVKRNQTVTVICDGPDQDLAVFKLEEFFKEKL